MSGECVICDSSSRRVRGGGLEVDYDPDALVCVDCKAQYTWNEGFMLSSRWAAGEIRRLQARIKEVER